MDMTASTKAPMPAKVLESLKKGILVRTTKVIVKTKMKGKIIWNCDNSPKSKGVAMVTWALQ